MAGGRNETPVPGKRIFDRLYLFPDGEEVSCPHQELDWYQRSIWRKVAYCTEHGISIFFDDERAVIELFRRYAPKITVICVEK